MGATDSKLAFRKSVFRLFEERSVPVTADEYWSMFWTLPESADDVFSLFAPSDIRRARDAARENLETLIDKLLQTMDATICSSSFPSVETPISHLLNCCRVLTRIMPYIFENSDLQEWEEKFFWTPRTVQLPDEPEEGESEADQKAHPRYDTLPPRGEILVKLTLRSLFLVGFTLPQSIEATDSRVKYVIWETGVGSSAPIKSTRDNDENRTEMLRLLLVLLSRSMYVSPSHILAKEDRWLHCVAAKTERKVVLALLCSLLNTACKYNPLSWNIPYKHALMPYTREPLVVMCLRVLLVILDYLSPHDVHTKRQKSQTSSVRDTASDIAVLSIQDDDPSTSRATSSETGRSGSGDASDNMFVFYLSKLYREEDFYFLYVGIDRILNPTQSVHELLPHSTKRTRCHTEMIMLLWKLLEVNTRFRNYLMGERALDLTISLLYYAMENKRNPAQVGLVRMCTLILQSLSSGQGYGAMLNRPFQLHSTLPSSIRIPNFSGTYADFVIISIHTLIATSGGSLSTLYPAMVLTITNVSPQLQHLSAVSSSKLVHLFGSISAPGFLLADESNHRLVKHLLEALNNVVEIHYADNPNLVYAILRQRAKFDRLRDLTLESALAEMEQARQDKEEKTRLHHSTALSTPIATHVYSEPENVSGGAPLSPLEEGLSEKAKGKLPEGALSEASRTASSSSLHDYPSAPQRQNSTASTMSERSLLPGARHGFLPTEEWVQHWHAGLPLETVLALIDHIAPKMDAFCARQPSTSDASVIEYLRGLDMSHVIQPHEAVTHEVIWEEARVIWFRSMLWGQAYVSSIKGCGPWHGTHVKLFQIIQQQQQQQTQPSSQQPVQPAAQPAPPTSSEV